MSAICADTPARAEVDIFVVNVVIADSVSWLFMVPVGLFHQIPKPEDGPDLVITEAGEFPAIKLGVVVSIVQWSATIFFPHHLSYISILKITDSFCSVAKSFSDEIDTKLFVAVEPVV